MTIVTIDIETNGLEATKEAFLLGCITNENLKSEVFYKPNEMWDKLIEKGKKVGQNGGVLNVYAHNMGGFDWWAFADISNKNLVYFCDNPFICSYRYNGKDIIKFLDTYSIFRMSLKDMGELIDYPKMETPQELMDGNIKGDLKRFIPYMVRDSEICMKSLQFMKEKMDKEGVRLKRFYTIHQIAIQYMLNRFKADEKPYLFYNAERNQVLFTEQKKLVHEAYRGGRVECFKTFKVPNVTYIDKNSLYPECCMEIEFPDLRTQEYIKYPLNIYTTKNLLQLNGVLRAMVKNKSCEIGLLPIRTPTFSYYPKKDTIIIGTWTVEELRTALKNGYELLDVEWVIKYNSVKKNPYRDIIPNLYKKRLGKNKFNSYFYKSIMNNHLGKFAQRRIGQEIVIDNVETTQEYIKAGYTATQGVKGTYNYMFKKTDEKWKLKPYYCPLIPIAVNAHARVKMFEEMKKIGIKDLVYTDTDSIMFTGNHLKKFNISEKLGDYKIEIENEDILIWGRKTYKIGNLIKASGIHKVDLDSKNFEKGYSDTKNIIKLKSAENPKQVGTFKSERRDFREQLENYNKSVELLEATEFLQDYSILDISYFLDTLTERFK